MSNYSPRLTAGEIKYIALEGGGGKGNAFIGALEALAHPDLDVIRNTGYRLTNILGVSGASAGAITSLFLACGFTPIELKTITELEDFNNFFDGPDPGRVFRIGGFQTITRTDPLTAALIAWVQELLALMKDTDLDRMAAYIAGRAHVSDLVGALRHLGDLLADLPSAGANPVDAFRQIQEALERLRAIGLQDLADAAQAVRELLAFIPPAVWNHLVRLAVLQHELERLLINGTVLAYLAGQINAALAVIRPLLPNATYQRLLDREVSATATAFVQDFGILTGEAIYNFFRRWMAVARMRINSPSAYQSHLSAAGGDIPACFRNLKALVESGSDAQLTQYRDDNMNFTAFEREFRVKFVLVGSNLETFKSHVFSGATTPNFYVVDAVRLSMSLPYCIFKPLVIRENDPAFDRVKGPDENLRERDPVSNVRERHPLIGVWVDGGLFNNIPSHVFDRAPVAGETLGLRLGAEPPVAVNNIMNYYMQFPGNLVFGAGETLSSRSYDDKYRNIILDTGDLGLLTFSPTAAQARAVRTSAIQYVFRYFGRDVPDGL